MQERKFKIANASGENLACVEVRPELGLDAKLPVVILCHGFAYFKEEDGIFTEVATRLARKGFVVYYFDFSGCGESEGNYQETTLTKLVDDLDAVLETVKSYGYVDSKDVSLMGHSFGTNVIIAAQIPEVKRIVLSGSFSNPDKIIGNLFTDLNKEGLSTRSGSGDRTTTIGPQFWSDLKNYDLANLIHNFDCPVLFVHGQKDGIVPIENMKPLLQVTKNLAGEIILDQSDHDLKPQRQQAFEAVETFFTVKGN